MYLSVCIKILKWYLQVYNKQILTLGQINLIVRFSSSRLQIFNETGGNL